MAPKKSDIFPSRKPQPVVAPSFEKSKKQEREERNREYQRILQRFRESENPMRNRIEFHAHLKRAFPHLKNPYK
jgi:hypothetical protein